MPDRGAKPREQAADDPEADLFKSIALDLLDGIEPGSLVGDLVERTWDRAEAEELVASIEEDVAAIFDAIGEGQGHEEIVAELVARDWDAGSARRVVKEARAAAQAVRRARPDEALPRVEESGLAKLMPDELEARARRRMTFGALWFFGGIVFTALSFLVIGRGGYVLAWGAMLYGFVEFLRGAYASSRIRRNG